MREGPGLELIDESLSRQAPLVAGLGQDLDQSPPISSTTRPPAANGAIPRVAST